jgi:hypothetical protein
MARMIVAAPEYVKGKVCIFQVPQPNIDDFSNIMIVQPKEAQGARRSSGRGCGDQVRIHKIAKLGREFRYPLSAHLSSQACF